LQSTLLLKESPPNGQGKKTSFLRHQGRQGQRLGTPPTSFPLPTLKEKAAAKPKHKETLADLLNQKD